MTPAARWALRAYPPSFRDRYGPEVAALTEDLAPTWRSTTGLYLGAARAWLRPAYSGPDATRQRLQSSVITVWVAWCAGFMLAPAMNKALLDPPGPGVDATVRRLIDASDAVLAAGWVVALAGVALVAWRSLAPALRARRWAVLRPLLPAFVLGIIEAAGLVVLVAAAWSVGSHPTPAMIALASAWLVGLLAFLVSIGIGPAVTIRRLGPEATVLRAAAVLSVGLALCLVALTATSVVAVLVADGGGLIGVFAPVAAVLAVGVVASSTALVSSARGVLAMRG